MWKAVISTTSPRSHGARATSMRRSGGSAPTLTRVGSVLAAGEEVGDGRLAPSDLAARWAASRLRFHAARLPAPSRWYGLCRLVRVLRETMPIDQRAALASLGARVVVTPNAPPTSPDNFRKVAKRMLTRWDRHRPEPWMQGQGT